jgi:hypothetical protein
LENPNGISDNHEEAAIERCPLVEMGIVVQIPYSPKGIEDGELPHHSFDFFVFRELPAVQKDGYAAEYFKERIDEVREFLKGCYP